MRRLVALVAVVGLSCLGLVSGVAPAGAKVAGANGQIAFARFDPNVGDTGTFIANADGTGVRALFPGVGTGLPRWSPDGSRLAILAGLDNPCPPCAASTIILNPDTGSYRVLSPPDPNLSTACSIWSPDAKRFACETESNDGTRNGIYTIRTSDGRGLTQVTSNPGGDDVPIDYSPNGKMLVFGRNGHSCDTRSALYVVNVDGSGLHRITPWGFCDDDGSWSPDGTTIVFGYFGALWIVHPDGKGLQKISLNLGSLTTSFNAFDVGWSPDGAKIVFSLSWRASDGTTHEGIATAYPDGTGVQMVTVSPTRDHQSDWGSHPAST